MRRIVTSAVVGLIACACFAGLRQNHLSIDLGTNTTGTATANLNGFVEAVYAAVSDGTSTGTVTVAYAPLAGGTSVNLATNSVTDEKVWRPRVDGTDVAGAALSSDTPGRFALAGELVTFTVASSPTGLVWTVKIVTDE